MTPPTDDAALRYAIVGAGAAIAPLHLRALENLPRARVVGMADPTPGRAAARAAEAGCPLFADHRAMLAELAPDVVVVCTPHPSHAGVAMDALAAGAHVLVEKPVADEAAAADRMIAAAEAAGRVLAVSLQQRFRPSVERARAFVAAELGPLVRASCVEPWFRPAAYYKAASWRGSWRGEGGGVLLNQAPHTLDLLCHLAGQPSRVWGWARTVRHAIETEDSAQAMLEFPNGAPGYFASSTVEAGSPRRLEVVGERGGLELVGDVLTLRRFSSPLPEFSRESTEPFSEPAVTAQQLELPGDGGGHLAVHRDLLEAIREGRPPRVTGQEALMSLELANAITLSSRSGRPVDLPLDRAAYSGLLAGLRREARA